MSSRFQGATPAVALFLELGILPIRFEIEKGKLFFFKCLHEKDTNDPVQSVYFKQLKHVAEKKLGKLHSRLKTHIQSSTQL